MKTIDVFSTFYSLNLAMFAGPTISKSLPDMLRDPAIES